jgi:hypothetical protein
MELPDGVLSTVFVDISVSSSRIGKVQFPADKEILFVRY